MNLRILALTIAVAHAVCAENAAKITKASGLRFQKVPVSIADSLKDGKIKYVEAAPGHCLLSVSGTIVNPTDNKQSVNLRMTPTATVLIDGAGKEYFPVYYFSAASQSLVPFVGRTSSWNLPPHRPIGVGGVFEVPMAQTKFTLRVDYAQFEFEVPSDAIGQIHTMNEYADWTIKQVAVLSAADVKGLFKDGKTDLVDDEKVLKVVMTCKPKVCNGYLGREAPKDPSIFGWHAGEIGIRYGGGTYMPCIGAIHNYDPTGLIDPSCFYQDPSDDWDYAARQPRVHFFRFPAGAQKTFDITYFNQTVVSGIVPE